MHKNACEQLLPTLRSREGNVFTGVCHSVHGGMSGIGGVSPGGSSGGCLQPRKPLPEGVSR